MGKISMDREIETILELDEQTRASKTWRNWLIWGALAIAGFVALFLLLRGGQSGEGVSFTTRQIERGALTVTVSATGTIEPLNEVNVGIEVSGTVNEVLVDFNDVVEKGQVLARLDTSILAAEVAQSQASLDLARAAHAEARATLTQVESDLARLENVRELSAGVLPAAQEIDAAQAVVERAAASIASTRAQIRQSEAQLAVKST